MKKPDNTEIALLQARHLYNDTKIIKVVRGGGFTVGKDTLIIEVNRMAWGLFEQSVLRAMKERNDLRTWSPELVKDDQECAECKGVGKFPYSGEEREKAVANWNNGLDPNDSMYIKSDEEISKFCSPCQGTGLVLKVQE